MVSVILGANEVVIIEPPSGTNEVIVVPVVGAPGPPGPPGPEGPPGPGGDPQWDDIEGKPTTFPPTLPIPWDDVSDKPTSFPVAWTDVTDKPTAFPPELPIDWDDVDDKPTSFPTTWSDVSGKPATFPPTLPITYAGVSGLEDALTGLSEYAIQAETDIIDLQANKADLVGGLVPASQLPSYVDDVLSFANLAAFPAVGEDGKIYIAKDTNLTYRWTGATYGVLDPSLALGETSSTAYRGDRGKIAYDHSQITSGNPHGVTPAMIGAQPVDSDLTTIAGLNPTTDNIIQSVGGSWASRTMAQLKTALALVKGDVGLGNVDNTSNNTERAAVATLTNKRITPRVTSVVSSASVNIDFDTTDMLYVTAQAAGLTFAFAGTPTNGQPITIAVKDDGSARAIIYPSSQIRVIGSALPASTVAGKWFYWGGRWSTADSKLHVIAQRQEP